MKITITVYGLVEARVEDGEVKTTNHYFATKENRDEMLMWFIEDNDCEFYPFEYEEEVEV